MIERLLASEKASLLRRLLVNEEVSLLSIFELSSGIPY